MRGFLYWIRWLPNFQRPSTCKQTRLPRYLEGYCVMHLGRRRHGADDIQCFSKSIECKAVSDVMSTQMEHGQITIITLTSVQMVCNLCTCTSLNLHLQVFCWFWFMTSGLFLLLCSFDPSLLLRTGLSCTLPRSGERLNLILWNHSSTKLAWHSAYSAPLNQGVVQFRITAVCFLVMNSIECY